MPTRLHKYVFGSSYRVVSGVMFEEAGNEWFLSPPLPRVLQPGKNKSVFKVPVSILAREFSC